MKEYLTQDGHQFIIRKPAAKDAEAIINYSKHLFASTDQVLTMPEEYNITVDDELKWISSLNANPNALLQIATSDNNIVGLLFFIPNAKKKNAHSGEFGVNVHPKYQALGIGQLLVESLLNWARVHQQIEKVYLQVFATNNNAIKLYKKLGFIKEGRHVKAIRQPGGEYVDVLQMYIETK